MLAPLLVLLPLAIALQLPHFKPQDALRAADDLLHGMSPDNEFTLASIKGDEHYQFKHPRYPVSLVPPSGGLHGFVWNRRGE